MVFPRRFLNKKFLLLLIIITLLIYVINSIIIHRNTEINLNEFKVTDLVYHKKSDTKYILYWSPFWARWDHIIGYGSKPFENCEYSNCYATANRTLIPLEDFDVLLFHALYNKKQHGAPWVRFPHQMYVFVNVEAPIYICPELKQYKSYFNWTMTHRYDSDIVRRHGYVFQEKTNYSLPSKQFVKNKTSIAAWMASNCHTGGRREELVQEIKKYMPVDVYGHCGKLKCAHDKRNGKLSSPACYDMVEKKYKFYFAFENSYCKDYSTEKLYNTLKKDVVPVVYGFGDYKLSAPPNSVISVADFDNVEELVNYLKYLDENVDEYLKYFEWKKDYTVTTAEKIYACGLCKKAQEAAKPSVYNDLHEWWWGKNKSFCKTGKLLPKIVSDLL